MNKTYLLFIATLVCAFQQQPPKTKEQIFSELYVLEGKWVMETVNRTLIEEWTKVNDSLLKSRSFAIKDNDTTLLEEVELRLLGPYIYYIPTVKTENKSKMVLFKLMSTKN